MATTRRNKSNTGAKNASKRPTGTKKSAKTAAAKKASKPAAARPVSTGRGTAAPASTDIRQQYKSFLLADYLGQTKAAPGKTGKNK